MNEELGEIAYNAYCKARNWTSVRGQALPHWKQQEEALRAAWCIAAAAVAKKIDSVWAGTGSSQEQAKPAPVEGPL